ncbi:ninjurin-2-like isoform X3 [Amphibalanus amphitrite]|uniref:ninjurin-2-like isoform X3 n=1 Tax=Amphibalanus amphitrite TaxID=1232801 RepID=UPI001C913374|nr:ninjurin-2-like isoform X3 [Amphibalanus amphitrite]
MRLPPLRIGNSHTPIHTLTLDSPEVKEKVPEQVSMTGAGRRGDGTINRKLDANRYATKKTIAQGMLDVALLTANASQLRYVLQAGDQHEFYTLMVTLISISIALQLVIGILSLSLNLLRDCRLDQEEYARSANALNYASLTLVFLATTANVLIAAFDVRESVQSNNDVQVTAALYDDVSDVIP